jgi:Protein of unknown function (DUF3551)
MTMIRAVPVMLALATLSAIDARPAAAEVYRPWCAQYTGGNGDDGMTCTFASYEQCMLTARGSGAFCVQNPWYLQYGSGQGENKGERPRRR